MKTLQCREHGGTFEIVPRRGRPPVRCTEDNPCDMMPSAAERHGVTPRQLSRVEKEKVVASTIKNRRPPEREEPAKKATKTRPEAGPVTVRHNPSVVKAREAKEQLEPLGWVCKGRGWFDVDTTTEEPSDVRAWTELLCTRGTETLILQWMDGKLKTQQYTVWDGDTSPAGNGKPKSRLPFDPNEMTDGELIKIIAGQKITWWNRLGKSTEHGIISGDKIQIEHTFSATGNESLRIVKFVDASGGGFRAFHVEAMMKVG